MRRAAGARAGTRLKVGDSFSHYQAAPKLLADPALEETSICVVDGDGKIVCEGTVISEPEAIAEFIKTKAPHATRIGLETGPTTTWLWHELRGLGLPVSRSSMQRKRSSHTKSE